MSDTTQSRVALLQSGLSVANVAMAALAHAGVTVRLEVRRHPDPNSTTPPRLELILIAPGDDRE